MASSKAPSEDIYKSKSALIKHLRASGIEEYDFEEADGQLQYNLDSAEEEKHLDALKAKLAELRAKQTAEGTLPELDTTHPGYLEDGTPAALFWLKCCLRVRKYDEERALELYDKYRALRIELGVDDPNDPDHEEMLRFIDADVMRYCGNQDKRGRYIFSMDAAKFIPSEWTQRAIMKSCHHYVTWLMTTFPEAQSRGAVSISDMNGWSRTNYDPEMEKTLMKTFQNKMPLRDGGFYAINTPFMIRAVMPIVKLFLKKKVRDRMHFYKDPSNLLKHVAIDQLDCEFGGSFVRSYECHKVQVPLPIPGVDSKADASAPSSAEVDQLTSQVKSVIV
jgi:hypothetical protein